MSEVTEDTVTLSIDKLWDLVRDAYEEAINEVEDEDTGTRQQWGRSESKKQVEQFLEWYWSKQPF